MSSDWQVVEKRVRRRKPRSSNPQKQNEEDRISDVILAHLEKCNRAQTPEDIKEALGVPIGLVWDALDTDLVDKTIRKGNRWTLKASARVYLLVLRHFRLSSPLFDCI